MSTKSTDWGMFTDDGNSAVDSAVHQVEADYPKLSPISATAAVTRSVSKQHPEVHDTEVQDCLRDYFVDGRAPERYVIDGLRNVEGAQADRDFHGGP